MWPLTDNINKTPKGTDSVLFEPPNSEIHREVCHVDHFSKKGTNNFSLYITQFHRSPPWVDLHRIRRSGLPRRHNQP